MNLIPTKTWIKVQEFLEQNKSKGYRMPRSNKALFTGLLWCRCGNRMYPKFSKRFTVEGKSVYTYVCKMEGRSKRSLYNRRDAHSNLLDAAIMKKVKKLAGNDSTFLTQSEENKWFYTANREEYDKRLGAVHSQGADILSALNIRNPDSAEKTTLRILSPSEMWTTRTRNPRTIFQPRPIGVRIVKSKPN